MKTAIVYYSMLGNTDYAVNKIKNAVDCDVIRLTPEKAYPDKGFKKFLWGGKSAVMGEKPRLLPYRFEYDKYDRVIFGTPVWASSFAPPLRTFIEENRGGLKGKDFSLIMCCSGGGTDKVTEKLKKALGVDSLTAQVTLIDPKDKPSEENERKIKEFITELKG